jgi:hypothetical protein
VGIDPTEGELLSFCTAAVLEGVVCESSVVAVVVEDVDAVLLRKVFKGLLGFHGFLGGKLGHQMNVLEPGVVVHEDGGRRVTLLGECPLQLSNEAHLRLKSYTTLTHCPAFFATNTSKEVSLPLQGILVMAPKGIPRRPGA